MLCDCCSNRAPSTLRPKLTRELVCCGALRIGSALSFFPLFPPFFLFGIARIDAVLAEAAAETAAATADALACVDESERKAGDGCNVEYRMSPLTSPPVGRITEAFALPLFG